MGNTYTQCQSCGMPLRLDTKGGGTEKDGSLSHVYCSSCCRDGMFLDPDITLSQMQQKVDSVLKNEMGWRKIFRWFAVQQIPRGERWKTESSSIS